MRWCEAARGDGRPATVDGYLGIGLVLRRCSEPQCRLPKHGAWGCSDDRKRTQAVCASGWSNLCTCRWVPVLGCALTCGKTRAFAFYLHFSHVETLHQSLLLNPLMNMMAAAQPQCAHLHSLAEALAVDFVRGGTSAYSQAPRLMKQAFPDAPALRCEQMPAERNTCRYV